MKEMIEKTTQSIILAYFKCDIWLSIQAGLSNQKIESHGLILFPVSQNHTIIIWYCTVMEESFHPVLCEMAQPLIHNDFKGFCP